MPVVNGAPKQVALNFTGIGAVQLERPHRIRKAAARAVLDSAADW